MRHTFQINGHYCEIATGKLARLSEDEPLREIFPSYFYVIAATCSRGGTWLWLEQEIGEGEDAIAFSEMYRFMRDVVLVHPFKSATIFSTPLAQATSTVVS